MADDSSSSMTKAIEAGRGPLDPQPKRPVERPAWYRFEYPSGRAIKGHEFDVGTRYTLRETRGGFVFTYHSVMCHASTAGECCDSSLPDPMTGRLPLVTWTVAK